MAQTGIAADASGDHIIGISNGELFMNTKTHIGCHCIITFVSCSDPEFILPVKIDIAVILKWRIRHQTQ